MTTPAFNQTEDINVLITRIDCKLDNLSTKVDNIAISVKEHQDSLVELKTKDKVVKSTWNWILGVLGVFAASGILEIIIHH